MFSLKPKEGGASAPPPPPPKNTLLKGGIALSLLLILGHELESRLTRDAQGVQVLKSGLRFLSISSQIKRIK